MGLITSITLYGVPGGPRAYPHTGSYAKAAGLLPKEHSSGKHKGQLGLTKRGPSVAHFYLYFAALRLLPRNGPARHWYDVKVARAGGCSMTAPTGM